MRDSLLKRPIADRDFVVVGATAEQMTDAGYLPVGNDFPVFLHPQTKEEYALARTEKKHGRGYRGFVFYADAHVKLEDDLRRRDLTINAIAQDDDGNLIDPFNGAQDIADKRLRHVSPAFAEDPLRVLRVARFAAMLPSFIIADETLTLMRQMSDSGELTALSAERIWQELMRGFAAKQPSRMIKVLRECGALTHILPEIAALDGVPERVDYHPEGDSFIHTLMAIDAATHLGLSAEEHFATALHDIGKAQTPPDILPSHHGHEARGAKLAAQLCQRLKTPRAVAHLTITVCAEHGNAHNALAARAGTVIDMLTRLDAHRRRPHALSFLRVCEADYAYWKPRYNTVYAQGAFIKEVIEALDELDSGEIAKKYETPIKIADQIRQARIKIARQIRKSDHHEEAWQKILAYKP